MAKILRDMKNYLKKLCNNDETCVFIVLILVGLLLCMLFNKDGFSNNDGSVDKALGHAVDMGEKVFGFGKAAPHSADNTLYGKDHSEGEPVVGLKPKPNRADPVPPSMKTEMHTLGGVTQPAPTKQQVPGVLIQDGSITRPFDEVWNPG